MKYSEKMPIQYQEAKASFMDMDIYVDPRVLIPRPETELLVSTAVDLCYRKEIKDPQILDIGTGSGVISLGIKKLMPEAEIIASDVSQGALDVAKMNFTLQGYENKIKLVKSDLYSEFHTGYEGLFDVIVSNPPYISENDYSKLDLWVKAEPKIALDGGEDGMDKLNVIAAESFNYLKPGGFVAVEIGYDQSEKMKNKLTECGYINVQAFKDFNNYERVIVGWKRG
jgi:release factor glutamine methyltransferase